MENSNDNTLEYITPQNIEDVDDGFAENDNDNHFELLDREQRINKWCIKILKI